MNTISEIAIGLTQFLDFTLKGSGVAKTNYVRRLKQQPDYHPSFDYWKQLRDTIRYIHENDQDISELTNLINEIDPKKRDNYKAAIKQYARFLKNRKYEWFDFGKSHWIFEDLFVRSTPEIGLIIDGEPHLIKLFFKGKNERIDKHNIASTLTLMNDSSFSDRPSEDINYSVLNIQKCRLHTSNTLTRDLLLSLESDASQLIYLWNNV